jgi:hypothetical protein
VAGDGALKIKPPSRTAANFWIFGRVIAGLPSSPEMVSRRRQFRSCVCELDCRKRAYRPVYRRFPANALQEALSFPQSAKIDDKAIDLGILRLLSYQE